MGVKVVDLKRDRRTLVIPIQVGTDQDTDEAVTEDLTVIYRPSAYTPDLEDTLNQKLKGDWKSAMGIGFVTSLVLEWDLVEDLTDEEGNVTEKDVPVPLTEAGMRPLPSDFIGAVITGVAEDMGKRGRPSTAG